MAYTLCFIGGAAFGAALLLLGIKTGNTAQKKAPDAETILDAQRRREREKEECEMQEKEAESLRKQFENMMNYTGEAQI